MPAFHLEYQAFTEASTELAATQQRHAAELAAAQAKVDAAKTALFAQMTEGEEYRTDASHPPLIKRVGDQIVTVTKSFLGNPE